MDGIEYRALVLSGKEKVGVEILKTEPLRPGWVRVRLGAGGICGSDLHYFRDFGNSGFTLQNPVVMGHEASGSIAEVGPGVTGLKAGDKVAVNPVMNCGLCKACRRGEFNLCERKKFPGSAMNTPHIHGFFREYFDTEARLCVKVPDDTDLRRIAFAEPLACSLHAVRQLGELIGRHVLVTGSGPIGVLAAAAAKASGAGRVTITDIVDEPLKIALGMGADAAVNTKKIKLADALAGGPPVDAAVEASGALPAVIDCMNVIRRGGSLVQLGVTPAGEIAVPWIYLQSREIKIFGSNQFHCEYDIAVSLILGGRVDPLPMLSEQFTFERANEAFALASDRRRCMKLQFIPEAD